MPKHGLFLPIDPGKTVAFAMLFHRTTASIVFDAYLAAECGDASLRCRSEGWFTHRHSSKSQGSDAIHILCSIDPVEAAPLIDLCLNRMLQQNPMHIGIGIQAGDLLE